MHHFWLYQQGTCSGPTERFAVCLALRYPWKIIFCVLSWAVSVHEQIRQLYYSSDLLVLSNCEEEILQESVHYYWRGVTCLSTFVKLNKVKQKDRF